MRLSRAPLSLPLVKGARQAANDGSRIRGHRSHPR